MIAGLVSPARSRPARQGRPTAIAASGVALELAEIGRRIPAAAHLRTARQTRAQIVRAFAAVFARF